MNKLSHINAPTADLIRSMHHFAITLKSSSISLLSAAVRLAEAGQDKEAMLLIDLAKELQGAEDMVQRHAKDAGAGMIVKMSTH